LGYSYYLLLGAAVFAMLASFGATLGRSIAMNQLGFSATAISMTTAIGGAIGLPIPLLIGWLSDRIGRKRLLFLSLACGLVSLPVLAFAGSDWGFWIAAALLALMSSSQPLMQALATDMLPAESIGMGLSMLSGASSVGLTASAISVGLALQQFGARPTFIFMALMPLAAMALVLPLRERAARRPALAGTGQPG
jgi:predicted MFS family arabinose efflux permease